MTKPSEEEVIALHEAAHAVLCVVQGLALQGATIGSAGKRVGTVTGPEYWPPKARQRPTIQERENARKYAIYILAGMAAELTEFGEDWKHGGSKDMQQVHRIADDYFPPNDQVPWVAEMLEAARSEVRDRWETIQSIADLLLKRDVTQMDIVLALAGNATET